MFPIDFDFTVSVGNLLTLVSLLAVAISFVVSNRNTIGALSQRLVSLETEIKKLTDVLIALGRQDERLNAIEHRIEDLRHGRGFVVEAFKERP